MNLLVLKTYAQRVNDLLDRHSRRLVWVGLFFVILYGWLNSNSFLTVAPTYANEEIYQKKEDIHNLYLAASKARWGDIPHWWIGTWIYPDVGYYRPLTSVLFFAEYRLFDKNFAAYNSVSLAMHLINIGLLYLLTISLFKKNRLWRVFLGFGSVYYFVSPANTLSFAIQKVLSWWPAQNNSIRQCRRSR